MTRLPDREVLRTLPRWALVAFAARCARRVQPLLYQAWPEPPYHVTRVVADAVHFVEQAATDGTFDEHIARQHALAADEAGEHVDEIATTRTESGCYYVVHAAANAVGAVAYGQEVVEASYFTASDASSAMKIIGQAANDPILADLERLGVLSRQQVWTDATPVSPGAFEPLPSLREGEDPSPEILTEQERARREAYEAWERAGRLQLTREQQEQMYFAALDRIRRRDR